MMNLESIAEKTLSNGLKIITLKKTGTPIVSVQIWYKTGSAFETDGCRGISHFLEHLMFRGSRSVKSEEHARRINDVGGHCNAFTAEDITAYSNSVPRDFLDMVLALESDRLDGLLLDPQTLETERKVIVEEYHNYMNNPVAKAFLEFRKEFFGGHPYAVSPLGIIGDIAAITVDKCRDYYQRHYAPDNAVMVVVGDVDESFVLDCVERRFGTKTPRTQPGSQPPAGAVRSDRARRLQRKVEFDVPVLVLGYPAPPSCHEDAVALEILQLAAAGGETSRLHREVVRRQALAVMAGGMNQLLKTSGMSIFFAAFTPDVSPGRVERAVTAELQRIRNDGLSREEMEKVRNSTLTSRTFELYSAENICQRIAFSETIEGDYRNWVKRLAALRGLDRDRLVAVARRWWNDDNRHVLVLKPRRAHPLVYLGGLLRRFVHAGRRAKPPKPGAAA